MKQFISGLKVEESSETSKEYRKKLEKGEKFNGGEGKGKNVVRDFGEVKKEVKIDRG